MLAGGLDTWDWLKDRVKRPAAIVDVGGGSRRGGATNAPAVFVRYDTVDAARDAAKQLMHEHQRVVRVMIVEEPSRFVEWMDRG